MVEEGVRSDDQGAEGVTPNAQEMFGLPELPADAPPGPHTPLQDVPRPPEQMQAIIDTIFSEHPPDGDTHQSTSVDQSASPIIPGHIQAPPEQSQSRHQVNYAKDPIDRAVQVVGLKIKEVWERIKEFFTGGPKQPQPMPA